VAQWLERRHKAGIYFLFANQKYHNKEQPSLKQEYKISPESMAICPSAKLGTKTDESTTRQIFEGVLCE
jgi:hypothetical protein